MDKPPALERLSEQEKDALIIALWAEVQRLQTRFAELEAKLQEPVKDARNSSVPPSHTRKANTPTRPPQGTRREASVGRAGGGRPLHPDPDQVIIAKAKVCPHCGEGVSEAGQALHAVYDKIEVPPVKPMVTRVEPYGGRCARCGQPYVAPVPAGLEPGTPFGASVQSLATYLRYTHAISDERLSALLAQVFGLDISEGGLAHLFQAVKGRLDQGVAEILTRLRSSRLICSDETSARVQRPAAVGMGVSKRRGVYPGHPPQPGPGRDPRSAGGTSADDLGVRSLSCAKEPSRCRLAGLFSPPGSGLPVCHRRWRCGVCATDEGGVPAGLCFSQAS